jgi:hypothetical protein
MNVAELESGSADFPAWLLFDLIQPAAQRFRIRRRWNVLAIGSACDAE